MVHFYQNIPGWFDFEDIYSYMVKLASYNAHFVEIGPFLGKSTVFLAVEIINSKKNIRLDTIDRFDVNNVTPRQMKILENTKIGFYESFKANISPVQSAINVISLPSFEASKHYEDRTLDFVFIDADHTYESVMLDIQSWVYKVREGGYLAGHDYEDADWPGVKKAVDEVFGNNVQIKNRSWIIKL